MCKAEEDRISLRNRRAAVSPPDEEAARAARCRIDELTKPLRSLGRIEELAVQLAGIAGGSGLPSSTYERRTVVVAAGDHGVAAEGVSAYPREVTVQMVGAFLAGIAAINAFARAVHAEVYVADFGVAAPLAAHSRLLDFKCALGTANFATGPAIPRAEIERALNAGFAAFDAVYTRGPFEVLALGDMGIANTTAAAAIVAALCRKPVAEVVGRGTGIDDRRLAVKIAVIQRALERLADTSWEAVASEVGGYEILGLAGLILAASENRIPVLLDGYIVGAAALIAQAIAPRSIGYCIAAHRSREPGHRAALEQLGLRPLLDLDLALGEGTGAALAFPLVEAAARMMREMRTFAEAGVATKEQPG